jgi:hypothetical protein
MNKTQLSPEEKIIAAYHVLVVGIETQHVASMMGVNLGRVSEACTAVKKAVGWIKLPGTDLLEAE